ncbi:MAG TPA: N-acetyltransferase, partial [Intrasporangium sp.]|nr:N-acetyltransferase [Intrasporangium sp.]
QAVSHVDAELREELLDLWVAVNAGGGAVGFVGSAPRDEVAARLDAHLATVSAGGSVLGVMRDPGGVLRGVGFWEHVDTLPLARTATLKRFMVDPLVQGRNLGRVLLGGLVALVRGERPSVVTLQLDYRSGTGVGDFYESCGWTEVGRIPRSLWLGGDDYRDDVLMARRVDAGPLVLDGRR